MGVLLLFALAWVVILVPPAMRASADRKEAFLGSFGGGPTAAAPPAARRRSARVQRRRHIAGGLLTATVVTLLAGLLPTFRVLLVVHLFLLDSFIAYVALLAHAADRAAKARRPVAEPATERSPVRRPRPARPVAPAPLPGLSPAPLL